MVIDHRLLNGVEDGMNPWVSLLLAGVFEVGFTTFMKLTNDDWKNPLQIGFAGCMIASFYFLQKAAQSIPLGTAYAVWTGIGASGTAIVGFLFFKDPFSWIKGFLLANLIASIVGLKLIM